MVRTSSPDKLLYDTVFGKGRWPQKVRKKGRREIIVFGPAMRLD